MNKKDYYFNENVIKNPTPEFCYFLGWIWADGHLSKNGLSLEILHEDAKDILPFFQKFCKPSLHERHRINRRKTLSIYIGKSILFDFLKIHNYFNKSNNPPNSILNYIPKRLKEFWYRGFFEGDGHISLTKQSTGFFISSSVEVYGPIDYDWSFWHDFLKENKIQFKTKKRIRLTGKSSIVSFSKQKDIITFFKAIYSLDKEMSLKRKMNKFNFLNDYLISSNKQQFTQNFLNFSQPS
jgi:hypothetical protein